MQKNSVTEAGNSASSCSPDDGTPNPNDLHSDFYNTGRSGRRNALPDILGHHCTTSTSDLPDQLSALSTSDKPLEGPSSSSAYSETGQGNSSTSSNNCNTSSSCISNNSNSGSNVKHNS